MTMDFGDLPLTRRRDLQTMFLVLLVFGVIMHASIWLKGAASSSNKDAFNDYILGGKIPLPKVRVTTAVSHSSSESENASSETESKKKSHTHELFQPGSKQLPKSQRILILSYQRSGSTYLGDLFGGLPSVFYVYEPLDALYMSLYGSAQGWNVPTDITNYANGTRRVLPDAETKAVSVYLDNLVNCHMTSLPVEAYHHRFWTQFEAEQQSLASAYTCLNSQLRGAKHCDVLLKGICNERFNSSDMYTNNKCHDSIAYMRHDRVQSGTNNKSHLVFKQHRQCLLASDDVIVRCKHQLQVLCSTSSLRVVKTVRLTMASVESLIQTNPDLKVIHLIRDPLGVLLSRSKLLSSYGLHSETLSAKVFSRGYVDYAARNRIQDGKIAKPGVMSFQREATMFCDTLYRDLVARKQLEDKYPGVFRQVIFEELVQDHINIVHDLYSFVGIASLNVSTPPRVHTDTVYQWRRELSSDVIADIQFRCRNIYSLVNSSSWNTS